MTSPVIQLHKVKGRVNTPSCSLCLFSFRWDFFLSLNLEDLFSLVFWYLFCFLRDLYFSCIWVAREVEQRIKVLKCWLNVVWLSLNVLQLIKIKKCSGFILGLDWVFGVKDRAKKKYFKWDKTLTLLPTDVNLLTVFTWFGQCFQLFCINSSIKDGYK